MKFKFRYLFSILLNLLLFSSIAPAQASAVYINASSEVKILESMHAISSHALFDYVTELCSETYGGRLTGSEGYNKAAARVAGLLDGWGIKPAGDKGSFLQSFKNPYTLVKGPTELYLHIPLKKKGLIKKYYRYEEDFCPGSTSDSGEITAEVVYVGYGITAPEINYDEYKGVDVEGKIVLMEREVPVYPGDEPEEFRKWRPYSFHQYKVKNARDHGAAGMLYRYNIVNPNCTFLKNFILTYVGQPVVDDIFAGTGKDHKKILNKIKESRMPHSFRTGKIVTMKAYTEHHPEGTGYNVIGYIEGSDPQLKKEAVVIGAHLDHLGYNHELIPGANDNASGVAVVLSVAEAMAKSAVKPKRSVVFIFFGAEEQGVKGSEYYLQHPVVPNDRVVGFINLDGVGRGTKLRVLAGKNYPRLMTFFDEANRRYIHRQIEATYFHNLARPRLDAARFMRAGIPSLSISTAGAAPLPYDTYHKTTDNPSIITPEIMEDLAQLIFIALTNMTTENFEK